jgi:hypothetical protein
MKLKAEGWSTTKEDSTYRSQYLMLNQRVTHAAFRLPLQNPECGGVDLAGD